MAGRCSVSRDHDDTHGDVTHDTVSSTESGGQLGQTVDKNPDDSDQSGYDLARTALAQARRMRRAAPTPSRDERRRAANRQANLRRDGYTGPGPDEHDPARIGEVLATLFAERGWSQPVTEARVFADWAGLVGAEIASRSEPVSLQGGELRVTAESTAWATQLRLMAPSIVARLAAELGPDVVRRLHVTGPVAPSWKHGGRAVRGARGPRDTYG